MTSWKSLYLALSVFQEMMITRLVVWDGTLEICMAQKTAVVSSGWPLAAGNEVIEQIND